MRLSRQARLSMQFSFLTPCERETVLNALNVRALDRQMDEYGDGFGDRSADLYRKLTGEDPDEEKSYS